MTGETTPVRWHSAGGTHLGTVRKVNEDAYLDLPQLGLWVVADGMGGHDAGDVASRLIVDDLRTCAPPPSREALLDDLDARLQSINARLQHYAAGRAEGAVVGSTVAILIGYGREAICLWAGDSRIYRLRQGQLVQLTQDHSQVEELVKLGLLDRAEAATHPAGNVITRAVGAMDNLVVDLVADEVADGDVYLLCSDGLNKALSDEEIARMLTGAECQSAVDTLLRAALDHQATDNITAVVARVDGMAGR